MRARLLNLWDAFRSSFWFVPLLFVLGAVALGIGMPIFDSRSGGWVTERITWMVTTTAAARPSLSAIGGAMITVTGVVFSITIVALSIASSQFGSRILRNFMDDRVTQVAIGMFVGTSLYCFLVMRTVREIDGTAFVPHISVLVSIVLAMLSIAVLVYFLHHVALAIQVPQILASLAIDLDDAIDRLFPEKIGDPPDDEQSAIDASREVDALGDNFAPLVANLQGYLQAVDAEGLIEIARDCDLVIEFGKKPGDFVIRETQIARAWPAVNLTADISARLNGSLIVGSRRTPRQDVLCTVEEMVEVAVRALSPGINDPSTAVMCIDRLTAACARFAGRRIPSSHRHDDEGNLRLVARPVSFSEMLTACFSRIREYGRSSASVMLHLLRSFQTLTECVERPQDRRALLGEAQAAVDAFDLATHQECDRELLQGQVEQLMESLRVSDVGDFRSELVGSE